MAQHKPRRRRGLPTADTMTLALHSAAKPQQADMQEIYTGLQNCQKSFQKGDATKMQWAVLGGSLAWAYAIERKGVVRGLAAVITAFAEAMNDIHDRAIVDGSWVPPTLYGHELAAMDDFVYWHCWQLKQLSRAELLQAAASAGGQIRQQGMQITFKTKFEGAK